MAERAVYSVKNYHPVHAGVLLALEAGGFEPILVVAETERTNIKTGSGLYATDAVHVPAGRISRLLFKRGDKKKYGREVPKIGDLLRLFAQHRPVLTLVYERSVRSTVTALVAFLFGSDVVQVLDSPTLPLKTSRLKHIRRLPSLWLRHLMSPKRRIHSGVMGARVGDRVSLGPLLGSSMLAPYPVTVDREDMFVRQFDGPLRIVCMTPSNQKRADMGQMLRSIASLIREDEARVTFVLWPGYAEEQASVLRAIEHELGLMPSEIQAGVSTSDLFKFFRAFHLLIYPATTLYGSAIPFALACGLPVICRENEGARVLIRNGINGFTYHPDDPTRLESIVKDLVARAEALEVLSQQALELSSQEFSPAAWLSHVASVRVGSRGPVGWVRLRGRMALRRAGQALRNIGRPSRGPRC